MKWIIQQNLIKPAILQEFREAFSVLEIAYEEVTVIPFSNELPAFTPSPINIFYGSTTLMLNAYHHPIYRKGVFYDPKTFNIEIYLEKWGTKMLNADGQVLSFEQFVTETVDQKPTWFLRPNEDDKSFAGTIMRADEIKSWYARILEIDNPSLNAHTLIFVSEPKEILREWRNFIVDGKVIESARYMLDGDLNVSKEDCPEEMIQFTEQCAADFSPHDIFVMDIAETTKGLAIIECNCFNGTGFYQHSILKIVESISSSIARS